MGKLTAASPKPLLAVNGRPIIVHILSGMAAAGIREVVVVTGYLGEAIEKALGDGARLGLHLEYRRQTKPEGTARALQLAQDALVGAPFLLSWGDIIADPSTYAALVERFRTRGVPTRRAHVYNNWGGYITPEDVQGLAA